MNCQRVLITALAGVLLATTPARAETLLTPFLGVTFGGDTTKSQTVFGASLGTGEIVGFEFDFSRSPDFFGDPELVGANHLTTLMGNLVIGIPLGVVRPYAIGGLGLLRSHIDGPGAVPDETKSDLGVSIGGGLTGYFSDHLGTTVDLRYFRNVSSNDERIFAFDLGSFDFWPAEFWGGVPLLKIVNPPRRLSSRLAPERLRLR